MEPHIEETLQQHHIRPTAVRNLIYQAIQYRSEAFSLANVEEWLPEMDRSSIFRTLRLFTEHQILHEIDDGSGIGKYCVCRCENRHHLNHVHFADVAKPTASKTTPFRSSPCLKVFILKRLNTSSKASALNAVSS